MTMSACGDESSFVWVVNLSYLHGHVSKWNSFLMFILWTLSPVNTKAMKKVFQRFWKISGFLKLHQLKKVLNCWASKKSWLYFSFPWIVIQNVWRLDLWSNNVCWNKILFSRCLLKLFHQFLLQTLWRDLLLHMQILTELTILFLKSEALKPTSCFL